ncbi:DNA-binding barrel domain superfamily [Sesbania bispinosa]|nr:DNA-binding barrel domain superfamily [Sesbania bispinosa]
MDSTSLRSVGPSATNVRRRATPNTTHRHDRSVVGFAFKEIWHPYQKQIKVARRLNDSLHPCLPKVVQFKDPAGNVSNISVKIRSGRQCFVQGLRQMGQFYDLHHIVHLYYTYVGNGQFDIRIKRPHGIGEIQYPQPRQQNVQPIPDDPKEVLSVSGCIIWETLLTKAQIRGIHGLVLPVRIVTDFLEEDQEIIHIKLPNGQVQPWNFLWNTTIQRHCRLGQGWYQYCREERLQEGDMLMFWKLDGEDFIRMDLRRQRDYLQ